MRSNPHSNAQLSTFNVQRSTLKDSLFTIHDSRFTPHASLGRDASPRRPRTGWGTVPAVSSRAAFTVLELVIVIGVLSILLAVVLPTIKTVHAAALRKKAQVGATALAQAAIRYKTEYGFWPGQLVRKDNLSVQLNTGYNPETRLHFIVYGPSAFTDDLTFKGVTSPNVLRLRSDGTPPDKSLYLAFSPVDLSVSGSPRPVNPLNPKAIHFLDLKNNTDPDSVDYPDSWGQPYRLVMGLNPRDTFEFTIKNSSGAVLHSFPVSNHTCFAFSVGSAGPNSTNYIYSAGVKP